MNTIDPNIPMPTRKSATMETAKIRLEKSESGRMGSSTRRSTTMKTRIPRSQSPRSPRIVDEPHGYCVPPQIRARRSETSATVSRRAPA